MPDDHDAPNGPAPEREDALFDGVPPVPPERRIDFDGGVGDQGTVLDGPAVTRRSQPVVPDALPASERTAAKSQSGGSFWRELPVLLLVAFLLAFLLRTFVLQVFYIPSGSMEPTLAIDDRMVVEKVTYRFRDVERGEIVVFEGENFGVVAPDATLGQRLVRGTGQFLGIVPASARDFVKRVIGLPGDEIRIEGGEVFVNDVALDEPYVVFDDPSDYGPVTVPEGSLFFLGDNRPNSSDSRRSLGMVDEDAVVGRAVVIIWPFDNAGSLTGTEYDPPPPPAAAD